MGATIEFNPEGTVTSAKGYVAGGTFAGLKTPGEGVLDLGLLVSELSASVAGAYSTNKILSPSVTVTKAKAAVEMRFERTCWGNSTAEIIGPEG
ncbi:MAG: hypothetical protein IIB17_05555 [Chloroflexi bacterium]|nr:hypothetical protein [Chloroflexota bacterium]